MIRFQKYNIDETGMAIPKGGIRKEALDVRALAEAQLYSPLNPYLDDKQKNICEVWYNLPTASFILSFIVFSSLLIRKPNNSNIFPLTLLFSILREFAKEKFLNKNRKI